MGKFKPGEGLQLGKTFQYVRVLKENNTGKAKAMLKEHGINDPHKFARGGSVKDVELPDCNLWLRGFDMDTNGNQVVKVGFPNDRAFSIQTNGVLPNTHRISKRGEKLKDLTEEDLSYISREVREYVKEFGSANQKQRLRIYG